MSGRFPSDTISMSDIALGFALPKPYSMSDFRNKVLYNPDGSSYTVPSGSVSMSYFRGRYYLDPSPYSISIYNNNSPSTISTVIAPPSNRPTPVRLDVLLIGPGGGGGGGGGGRYAPVLADNASGGGGGSGGAGAVISYTLSYTGVTSLKAYVGSSSQTNASGGGGASCDFDCRGASGNNGNIGTDDTWIEINGIKFWSAGKGSGGNGGEGGGWYSGTRGGYGGTGGTGGIAQQNNTIPGITVTNLITTNGTSGYSGGQGGQQRTGDPPDGPGGIAVSTLNYFNGRGGSGGNGRPNNNTGYSGSLGSNGFINITWYFQ